MILLAVWLLAAKPPSLAAVDAIPLSADLDGFDGRIELLEDARFHPGMRETWWGRDGAMACDEWQKYGDAETRELCASIEQSPLLPATIRLLDASGKILDERRFDRALAKLDHAVLYDSKRRTFLVTVDYSVGAGSYAGPVTYLAEPRGKSLEWLKARDADSGSVSEFRLIRTLKSDWRLTGRADGLGQDVLAVSCAPDFASASPEEGLPFAIHYFRYHFDGGRWIERQRTEPGFWESDPPESSFPSAEKFP